ncbi:hypothetical protein RvY_12626-2 [Ramazzottius varieornatus]|uniref:Uncharacterized protein n=1 Tax=Ramazzottius varieornatus TaxID=947166 RepID=A0A1D1VTV6_RAMVA|nr:hypothetical protein RvY_12626-2 [Ramazzottius varieornatus]
MGSTALLVTSSVTGSPTAPTAVTRAAVSSSSNAATCALSSPHIDAMVKTIAKMARMKASAPVSANPCPSQRWSVPRISSTATVSSASPTISGVTWRGTAVMATMRKTVPVTGRTSSSARTVAASKAGANAIAPTTAAIDRMKWAVPLMLARLTSTSAAMGLVRFGTWPARTVVAVVEDFLSGSNCI